MQVISFRAVRCISGTESQVGTKQETTRTQIQFGRCLFCVNVTFTLRRTVWQTAGNDISEKMIPTPKQRLTLTFLP
jgi:hypothetical protein